VASPKDEWDACWADYDARHPVASPAPEPSAPRLPARPAVPPARPRRRRLGLKIAALLLLAPLAWLAEPGAAAWQVLRAVESRDVAVLGRHLDLALVEAEMRSHLARVAARPSDDPAALYLGALAEDIARAWATPAGIATVAQFRAAPAGSAGARLQSVGLTEFEMRLGADHAPMTLRFGLTEGALLPRWQVTGVGLEPAP
jgi:hypothetical protein